MKRVLCTVLCLCLGLALAGGAAAADETVPGLSITCTPAAAGYICTADWTEDDGSYELVLTGMPDELTQEAAAEIIAAFRAGETYTLTDEGLTDAEKISSRVYSNLGSWIYEDDNRSGGSWGDSAMCWAASAANMLRLAGWASAAVDPDTGAAFGDEDEVFNYFRENFPNDGGYPYDAVHWFFDGTTVGETYPDEEGTGALLADQDPEDHCTFVSFDVSSDSYADIDSVVSRMAVLKDGGAVCLSVDFCSAYIPVLNGTFNIVSWDEVRGCFMQSVFEEVPADGVEEDVYYTYDASGSIVKLSAQDGGYYDAAGNSYDPLSVMQDSLYEYAEGVWLPVIVMGDAVYCSGKARVSEAVLDLDNTSVYPMIGNGSHAVTLTGYILQTDAEGAAAVRAVFLADSDNDAGLYTFTDDNISPETRPNTYTMYPVSVCDLDEGKTLEISDYMPYSETLIATMTTLGPAD